MSAATELIIKLKTPGVEKLPRLGQAFRNFTKDVTKTDLSLSKLRAELKLNDKQGAQSINNKRALARSWRELANSVEFGSKAFITATKRADRLDKKLRSMQTGGGALSRLKGFGKTAGAVAAAGVFGGAEGSIGALIGAAGGPLGAAAGGAIGAQVGMVRQAIGGVATYDAQLELQRKALKLVIGDTERYIQAQKFLADESRRLAIPQDVIVRQFTSLSASVIGAGGNIDDAKKAFEAVASGIRGTGGSLEDMKAAMTATSQVFSKGKVSAEELRQQLGERLPGAFTLFAESMGKTPAELDKALEGGKVTLQDFMTFADHLFKQYGNSAEILAKAPEAAGDRLATALSNYKDAVGEMLRPIGAGFQTTAAKVVEGLTWLTEAWNEFFGIGDENRIKKLKGELKFFEDIQRIVDGINKQLKKLPGGKIWGLEGTAGFEGLKGTINNRKKIIEQLEKENVLQKDKNRSIRDGNRILNQTAQLSQKVGDAIRAGIVDAIESAITGAKSLGEIFTGLLKQIGRMYLQSAIGGINLPGLGKKNEKGNVFAQNGIVPFAQGGVVDSPTIFPFKNGIGLMGEAGPEAIMPLTRGADGRLGVEALSRYSSGGSSSSPVGGGAEESSEDGGVATAGGPIDVRFTSERINSIDYVTFDQFQAGVAAAAQQGAKQGEMATLKRLRTSPGTRRGLGI